MASESRSRHLVVPTAAPDIIQWSATNATSATAYSLHPEKWPPRNIVLCFDGTTNRFGQLGITNVIRVYELLAKDIPYQLCYYQAGIGTYDARVPIGSEKVPIKTTAVKVVDTLFARGIKGHILGGYRYLMRHWRSGDRIYMFGFSRGAYTARALCGMLEKVGLLASGNEEQVAFAWKVYKTRNNDEREAAPFRRIFGQSVKIHFLGLWDTVRSTGITQSPFLPEPGMNYNDGDYTKEDYKREDGFVRYVFHALSIDEKRVKFEPLLYTTEETWTETIVIERWFAGDHCDVGGRFNLADRIEKTSLANPSFRWIIIAATLASRPGEEPGAFLFALARARAYSSTLFYDPRSAGYADRSDIPPEMQGEYASFTAPSTGPHGSMHVNAMTSSRIPERPILSTGGIPAQEAQPHRPPREQDEVKNPVNSQFDRVPYGWWWSFLELTKGRGLRGSPRQLPETSILHLSVKTKMDVDAAYGDSHQWLTKFHADEIFKFQTDASQDSPNHERYVHRNLKKAAEINVRLRERIGEDGIRTAAASRQGNAGNDPASYGQTSAERR